MMCAVPLITLFCLVKVCNGDGEEICQTVYESSCSTKVNKQIQGWKTNKTNRK